jgi:hypothetical protein
MGQDVELLLDTVLRIPFPLELFIELGSTGLRLAQSVLQKGESLFC